MAKETNPFADIQSMFFLENSATFDESKSPELKESDIADAAAGGEFMVLIRARKLCAYVIAATQKSPARFRAVFVIRMQNYCLDIIENIILANALRPGNPKRAEYQQAVMARLKMLDYIAMIAKICGCIVMRQYKQISILSSETSALCANWMKSDERISGRKDGDKGAL